MNIVAFDLLASQPAQGIKFHGGGEYIKTVFKELADNYTKQYRFIVFYNTDNYLDKWILNVLEEKNIEVVDVKNSKQIVKKLNDFNPGNKIRFFAGLAYAYAHESFPDNVTSIGTFHGLRSIEKQTDKYELMYYSSKELVKEMAKIILKSPLRNKYSEVFRSSLAVFDVIITDSMHSLYSLKLNYPECINGKDVKVFYPLTQPIVPYDESTAHNDNYIMIISANRWIKNSYRGIKAIDNLYSHSFLNGLSTKVFGNCPKRIRNSVKNQSRFMFYEYVSTDELEEAYKNCEILFYPTLNEGFGNVPMEAMKYGKTCVVSAVCSLPEVYRNSVYYCNPYDLMEMENRILQAVNRKISRKDIIKRLDELKEKQKSDLRSLCKLISNE